MFEQLRESLAGPGQAAAHGAFGNTGDLGDLGRGHAFPVVELERERWLRAMANRYRDLVFRPDDGDDWLEFQIVPGEVDPTIGVRLTCDIAGLDPQPLRAHLLDDEDQVLATIVCGEPEVQVTLPQASSQRSYWVQIELRDADASETRYALELDAFCFQGCDYTPYAP